MSLPTENMESPLSDLQGIVTQTASRRRFLFTGGAAVLGLMAAACGKSASSPSTTTNVATTGAPSASGAPSSTAASGATGDLTVGKAAAGLEVLAVGTYKAALDAASAGKLGAVPPAVAEYVTTAMGHHQAYLDSWNKVLKSNGQAEVTQPDAKLKPLVDQQFAQVKDVTGAAKLALMLEDIASATYLKALPGLQSKDAILLAGQGAVITMQHAAILHYALGEYPVPETFAKTDKAAF